MGRSFTLRIDHKPLLAIFGSWKGLPVLTATRLLHYALFLQTFNFNIVYRKNKEHRNADFFSRLPLTSKDFPTIDEPAVVNQLTLQTLPLSAHDLARFTKEDSELLQTMNSLTGGTMCKEVKGQETYFHMEPRCLMKGSRVVIPKRCREQILADLHVAHPGITKMKELGRSYVWWTGMHRDIERIVKKCERCQVNRNEPAKFYHPWEQ